MGKLPYFMVYNNYVQLGSTIWFVQPVLLFNVMSQKNTKLEVL